MLQNQFTTDEHYIPQFYLKQFSPDEKHIYQYDVLSDCKESRFVPIKSICYEKNLYELKNESGDIINRNLIEHHLAAFEGAFAEVFQSIQSKTRIEKNYYTLSFLNDREKALLVFFMTLNILRHPEIIRVATETAKEFFGDDLSERSARNMALQTCLPIYKEFNEKERNLLMSFMRLFDNMSFQIGVTKKERILTSDNPITIHGNNQSITFDEILFPLSPCLTLYMKPYNNTKRGCYNRMTVLSYEDVKYANGNLAMNCKRWIYSKKPLAKEQIAWLTKIRKS